MKYSPRVRNQGQILNLSSGRGWLGDVWIAPESPGIEWDLLDGYSDGGKTG